MIDIAAIRRPATSTVRQWWVLMTRVIKPTLRNGEVLTQVAASIMFTVGFYIPLKNFMGHFAQGMSSYAQYLMPLIALQAVTFATISAALRSATDSVQGINQRFKTMPIGTLIPLSARMSASMYRCAIALAVALACGFAIGFRFYGSAVHTVVFCLLLAFIGIALSLIGDVIGAANKNPEATMPILIIPQIVLGLLSVGLQPVEQFPSWIQGFVRDQPTSQYVFALRALADDSGPGAGVVSWSVIAPTLYWGGAFIVVLLPVHAWVSARRQ